MVYLDFLQLLFAVFNRNHARVQLFGNMRLPFFQVLQDAVDNGLVLLELHERLV